MNCPDLKQLFPQHRLESDPAADPRRPDLWMVVLPCRFGVVYPYGDGVLAVEVDFRPRVRRQLVEMGLKCIQDGDDEATFLFPVEDAAKVFKITKPLKKKTNKLSPADRRRDLPSLAPSFEG